MPYTYALRLGMVRYGMVSADIKRHNEREPRNHCNARCDCIDCMFLHFLRTLVRNEKKAKQSNDVVCVWPFLH